MSNQEQGPNQNNKQGSGVDGKEKPQHQQGEAPSQHTGGVGNRQNEPQTAEEAKKRAAEEARNN